MRSKVEVHVLSSIVSREVDLMGAGTATTMLPFLPMICLLELAAFATAEAFLCASHSPPSLTIRAPSESRRRQEDKVSTTTNTKATSSGGHGSPAQQNLPSIKYIAGRRCLVAPCRNSSSKGTNNPLVIIGGTAQTIASWEHQVPGLSKDRDVLVYECLGQGPVSVENGDRKMQNFSNVTLACQAEVLAGVVEAAHEQGIFLDPCVDVAGFSLGGRIALATASAYPHMIRKLHITGVGAARDEYAKVVIASWKDIVSQAGEQARSSNGEEATLRAFGWSTILATYSHDFVASMGSDRIGAWVDGIANQNTLEGIAALLQQTHGETEKDKWSPLSMAKRINQSQEGMAETDRIKGKLVVGGNDQMATPIEVKRLGKELGWDVTLLSTSAGHAVPMECGREWRADLLDFLSGN